MCLLAVLLLCSYPSIVWLEGLRWMGRRRRRFPSANSMRDLNNGYHKKSREGPALGLDFFTGRLAKSVVLSRVPRHYSTDDKMTDAVDGVREAICARQKSIFFLSQDKKFTLESLELNSSFALSLLTNVEKTLSFYVLSLWAERNPLVASGVFYSVLIYCTISSASISPLQCNCSSIMK